MNCHRHLIDIIADTFHPFMVRMHKHAPNSYLSDNCIPDGTSSKADAVLMSRRIFAGVLNSSSFSSSTGLQIWGKSVMRNITHLMFSNEGTGWAACLDRVSYRCQDQSAEVTHSGAKNLSPNESLRPSAPGQNCGDKTHHFHPFPTINTFRKLLRKTNQIPATAIYNGTRWTTPPHSRHSLYV